jgi:ubiquinone/menaquinone biosynthesis C-methylase UbiE
MRGHRLFAALYDRMLAGTERAGLTEMRAGLLSGARGRTLELGAGTGLNLRHYPEAVDELVLTEPDPHMARRLRGRLAEEPPLAHSVVVVEAAAESLPFDAASFDTAVCTLVLCSVDDPPRAAAEVARVLRPGGRLLYLEHVRGDERSLARWQDRLERPWGWIGAGCHPNRATGETLIASGLIVERLERERMPKAPPIVRPLIVGTAVKPDVGGYSGSA